MVTIRGNKGALILKNGNIASFGLWLEDNVVFLSANGHIVPIQTIPENLENSGQMVLNELVRIIKELDNSSLDLRDIFSKMT